MIIWLSILQGPYLLDYKDHSSSLHVWGRLSWSTAVNLCHEDERCFCRLHCWHWGQHIWKGETQLVTNCEKFGLSDMSKITQESLQQRCRGTKTCALSRLLPAEYKTLSFFYLCSKLTVPQLPSSFCTEMELLCPYVSFPTQYWLTSNRSLCSVKEEKPYTALPWASVNLWFYGVKCVLLTS